MDSSLKRERHRTAWLSLAAWAALSGACASPQVRGEGDAETPSGGGDSGPPTGTDASAGGTPDAPRSGGSEAGAAGPAGGSDATTKTDGTDAATPMDVGQLDGPATVSRGPTAGPLFYAHFGHEDETAALTNPSIAGALFQIYWSELQPGENTWSWALLETRIARWTAVGKKVALRILWSSSGYWRDPRAKRPTPSWVWSAGAQHAVHQDSDTEIPLFWDPVYQRLALQFLEAIAARYDSDPNVLFLDVTPGAETNPYRFGTIDAIDPAFRDVFTAKRASDGTTYSDARWWRTLQDWMPAVRARFSSLTLLVTLNRGGMPGDPSRLEAVGDLVAATGMMVGQNGLRGGSYANPSSGDSWRRWATRTRIFFEMFAATGPGVGTLGEVVDAALRVDCSYLNVYATDVVRGTAGSATFDAAHAGALARAASELGRGGRP